ncbi:hypothetical protein CORC01_14388 [Colletotrichum orchidophilum]|uniref:Uncharacterized protein n=1 Tax=Colletotrichum orchidophilum TaxID=1209926 RepID=A0A1G4AMK5_9PEZI|nr:uncharacterized protein CORC01_14388 [Colletotrichum orchidophilum]OHE90315.1 hypothetical protein CORC01_14388 [Colletotrichum orchidophilum]
MTTSNSEPEPYELFKKRGVLCMEDENIGKLVQEVDDQGLSTSLESWKFFKDTVHGNPTIRRILEGFLEPPNPHRCHTFGPEPGQVFCFWPQPDQTHRLVLSMWSAGTRLELHEGSHRGPLKAVLASNGLFEVPSASLEKHGIRAIPYDMEKGGM